VWLERADERLFSSALLRSALARDVRAADLGAQVEVMGDDARDAVIRLDERGVDLLKSLAGPCPEFRVTVLQDGSIVLRPMSAQDADLWRSGLADEIIENFSHPDWMIRLKADKL
jgi:hypothetical protein